MGISNLKLPSLIATIFFFVGVLFMTQCIWRLAAIVWSVQMIKQIIVLLIGIYFGIVLVKSEVVFWFRVQKMFRFEEAYMHLVMASAIAVGIISVALIKHFKLTTITGEVITIKEKWFQKGIIIGGTLFGMG
jgi:uncharacterized membrane protein YedE/YeeE